MEALSWEQNGSTSGCNREMAIEIVQMLALAIQSSPVFGSYTSDHRSRKHPSFRAEASSAAKLGYVHSINDGGVEQNGTCRYRLQAAVLQTACLVHQKIR